jgi:hypothetical protein
MTHGRRTAWAGSDPRSRLPPDWRRDGFACGT